MKKSLILFAAVLTVLGIAACSKAYEENTNHPEKYLFTMNNESDHDIYWFVPDRAADGATGELPEVLTKRLKENLSHVRKHSGGIMNIYVDGNPCPIETYKVDDRMPIYFFKAEVIDTTEWSKVVSDKLWEGMCWLSAQDVIDQGKKIYYPDCMTEFN